MSEDNEEKQEQENKEHLYQKLENLVKTLNNSLREDIFPEAEKKVKENPFLTVAVSFLAGALIAFVINTGGRRGH